MLLIEGKSNYFFDKNYYNWEPAMVSTAFYSPMDRNRAQHRIEKQQKMVISLLTVMMVNERQILMVAGAVEERQGRSAVPISCFCRDIQHTVPLN